jgi:peptide/nickel transport system ATP-binding protein
MTDTAMTASDLTIEYPAHSVSAAYTAVKGFSLTLEPGEVVGIVGSSGSGKSTLAEVISGSSASARNRDTPPRITGGSLSVLGYDVRHIRGKNLNRLTYSIGYLRQDAGATLTSNLTVAESIVEPLFLRDKHYDRHAAGLRAAILLDRLMLPVGMLNQQPHELSSGQRQRVAIARALILEPELLIVDEPTAGIDVSVRSQVIDEITAQQRQRGGSALIISHDLEVLARSVERILVLHEGVVIGLGSIEAVLADPRHPYVESLARMMSPAPPPVPPGPVLNQGAQDDN